MNNIEADHYTPRSNRHTPNNYIINSEASSQQISPAYVDVPGNQLLLDETNENAHLAWVCGICFCPTGFLALIFAREAGTNFRDGRIEEGRISRKSSYIASGLSVIIGITISVIIGIAIALIKGTTT